MKARWLLLPCCLAWAGLATGAVPDPSAQQYYPGPALATPIVPQLRAFPAADSRALFTSFAGVEGVTVANGVLRFTLTGAPATLGWGNCLGGQPPAAIPDLWEGRDDVILRVKQSAGQSKWTLTY